MATRLASLLPAIVIAGYAQNVDRPLKLEFDELSAKSMAAVDTVNSMEQRAKEAGQSLHPDLLAQRELVMSAMDSAAEALRDRNSDLLRKRLDRARGLVDRLLKMF